MSDAAIPAEDSYFGPTSAVDADAASLYVDLAPAVWGYLRSAGAVDPDDLLGEVFLHVARDIGRFRGDADAQRRWVFSIAHNRLIDDRRKRERRPQIADASLPDRPAPPIHHGLDPTLLAALAELTDDQRRVVTLRFVADLSIIDVARIMRRRPGAVKAMQHRALDQLSKRLA